MVSPNTDPPEPQERYAAGGADEDWDDFGDPVLTELWSNDKDAEYDRYDETKEKLDSDRRPARLTDG